MSGNGLLPPNIEPRPFNTVNLYALPIEAKTSGDYLDHLPIPFGNEGDGEDYLTNVFSQYKWDKKYILETSVTIDEPYYGQSLERVRVQDFSSLYPPIQYIKYEDSTQPPPPPTPDNSNKRGNDALPVGITPRPGNLINYYDLPKIALTDDNSYNHIPIRRQSETSDEMLWDQYYWDQKYILPKSIVFAGSVDVYEMLVKDQRIGDYSHLYDPIQYISYRGGGNNCLPVTMPPRPFNLTNKYFLAKDALTTDLNFAHFPFPTEGGDNPSQQQLNDMWAQYYWDQKYILAKSLVINGDHYAMYVKNQKIRDYSQYFNPIEYRNV